MTPIFALDYELCCERASGHGASVVPARRICFAAGSRAPLAPEPNAAVRRIPVPPPILACHGRDMPWCGWSSSLVHRPQHVGWVGGAASSYFLSHEYCSLGSVYKICVNTVTLPLTVACSMHDTHWHVAARAAAVFPSAPPLSPSAPLLSPSAPPLAPSAPPLARCALAEHHRSCRRSRRRGCHSHRRLRLHSRRCSRRHSHRRSRRARRRARR